VLLMKTRKTGKMLRVEPSDCGPYLQALSDVNRWEMVRRLFRGPMSVTEIADEVGIRQPSASKHLAILREAGIVITRREGKAVVVSLNPSFRARASGSADTLDLGCCNFQFGSNCC
jgi:predicted transcriptional regulator